MGNPYFHELLKRMAETHDKKNHDYAKGDNPFSNFEEAAAFAGVSVDRVFAIFIGTKQARINELVGGGKTPTNESLADSYLDLAVYATLRAAYALKRQGWSTEKKMEGEWRNAHDTDWGKGKTGYARARQVAADAAKDPAYRQMILDTLAEMREAMPPLHETLEGVVRG